jgi:uncharacterized membrane protein YidH (DUF202 family)
VGALVLAYLLKYIHAETANKTSVAIHSDELLISVFLAMSGILTLILGLRSHRFVEVFLP